MGQRRTRKKTHRSQKNQHLSCTIPIPAPVLTCSSVNFYESINDQWLSTTHIPAFENDFGVSEEVERCIYTKSVEILSNTDNPMLKELKASALNTRSQHVSVEYMKSILNSLGCIETPEDIIKHFSALAKSRIISIFNYQYNIGTDKKISLRMDSNAPSLPISLYQYDTITNAYKNLLDKVGDLFEIDQLSQIYEFEKGLAFQLDSCWSPDDIKIKGGKLLAKFPRIPWATWFEDSGLPWKQMNIYYNCPKWIRYLGKVLKEVPVSYWKLYLAKIYIFHALPYLPPPFNDLNYEFFDRLIQGQKVKMPQLEVFVNVVYRYTNDVFSELFWKEAGDPALIKPLEAFTKTLIKAAKKRISEAEWLGRGSRLAAIEKINKMKIETVRPKAWEKPAQLTLDHRNFIKNIHDLGSWNTNTMFSRIGKTYTFWEEGVYRVNAYYFNETNEIIIPYGTVIAPFYSLDATAAWNYGALGSIIGHEMCHGFDDDGKEFNANGEKRDWWTRGDKFRYKKKSKALIDLFHKQTVFHKHINGEKTLSENIADLGGVALSLEALKMDIEERGVTGERQLQEYRDFFQAFAVSWRTLYRKEKLESSVDLDPHAPAFLRVNLVVSQFQEWYDAFGVDETSPMYIPPEERIKIF
jgi:putative endopeptidase